MVQSSAIMPDNSLENVVGALGLDNPCGGSLSGRAVSGGYVSDLLSDVMGNARPGDIWVTIQSHLNIVAVAALKEFSAVVVCGGAEIEEAVLEKARSEGVVVLTTSKTSFEICGLLWEMGVRRSP